MILDPLPQPPPVPDGNKIAKESEARSNAEIQAANEKVAGKRAPPIVPTHQPTDGYTVELDWRGESAYYIETDRKLWLFCAYWGHIGSVEHINAVWEYIDGRRLPLTQEERLETLRRVLEYIKTRESFRMRARELE